MEFRTPAAPVSPSSGVEVRELTADTLVTTPLTLDAGQESYVFKRAVMLHKRGGHHQ